MRACTFLAGALLLATAGPGRGEAQEQRPQATSLLGKKLYPPELDEPTRSRLQENLDRARREFEKDPHNPDAVIWLGRRLAYLGDYRAAIEIFSRGMETFPEDPRFHRHRGHRFISVRELGAAVRDLEKAARLIRGVEDRVEPDGAPNARNIPRSTTHSNIWYHLGLAYYLQGDFENALRAYRQCRMVSRNDDTLVAASHWLYMILRRLGRDDEAGEILDPIHEELDVIENFSYHRLLLMYKGVLGEEELLPGEASDLELATVGYGVGNWHLYNGREAKAREVFERVLATDYWPAFGYIAAEAELAR